MAELGLGENLRVIIRKYLNRSSKLIHFIYVMLFQSFRDYFRSPIHSIPKANTFLSLFCSLDFMNCMSLGILRSRLLPISQSLRSEVSSHFLGSAPLPMLQTEEKILSFMVPLTETLLFS